MIEVKELLVIAFIITALIVIISSLYDLFKDRNNGGVIGEVEGRELFIPTIPLRSEQGYIWLDLKNNHTEIMVKRKYELLEHATTVSIKECSTGTTTKATFIEKPEHDFVYDSENMELYKIVSTEYEKIESHEVWIVELDTQ